MKFKIFLISYLFERLEKIAEATRNRLVLEAEAEAEATRVKGEAEAAAIEAKAKAEATIMAQKAEAWKEFKEAAMMDLYLQTLPKVTSSALLFMLCEL